ncbi:MAG TPA: hypothetical protein VJ964_11840 [Balneolaceae bacterium]|nr:hypothetical protein [Balneolaceae bacterium]
MSDYGYTGSILKYIIFAGIGFLLSGAVNLLLPTGSRGKPIPEIGSRSDSTVTVNQSIAHDTSKALQTSQDGKQELGGKNATQSVTEGPRITVPEGSEKVEQTVQGAKPSATFVTSFDGLGKGFHGPQGWIKLHNPSDNSLAVGPNHIVQIVNTRMAIYTKKGNRYDKTGKVLYGPVETRNVFRGFGGPCERRNNGDAVVRYDQLANRWVIVMPIFRPMAKKVDRSPLKDGAPARESVIGQQTQPGKARTLFNPPSDTSQRFTRGRPWKKDDNSGSYAMCYAVSTGPNPMGSYYRYGFLRQHFPDYPRPAVWPDGYYVPTSAGDKVVKKEACVAERNKMLKGEQANEQCVIIDGVNFLNNADLLGTQTPPSGAPNIMMAAGGTQLKGDFEGDGIYVWKYHVDWDNPANTKVSGPKKISVAPYHYLCDGQLMPCVPQPGTDQHLDSQGDKIMSRLVYRRIDDKESLVAVHSVNTSAGGGGVRWYEFRLDRQRNVNLYQQGTYAPDKFYRWLGSPAIDKNGDIGIGYSYGGTPHYVGQRFAGRMPGDPKGKLTLKETILTKGNASQKDNMRWEDYTQTAVDPTDDCTIWYVGDYYKEGASRYSTKIGAFRMPGCSDSE